MFILMVLSLTWIPWLSVCWLQSWVSWLVGVETQTSSEDTDCLTWSEVRSESAQNHNKIHARTLSKGLQIGSEIWAAQRNSDNVAATVWKNSYSVARSDISSVLTNVVMWNDSTDSVRTDLWMVLKIHFWVWNSKLSNHTAKVTTRARIGIEHYHQKVTPSETNSNFKARSMRDSLRVIQPAVSLLYSQEVSPTFCS